MHTLYFPFLPHKRTVARDFTHMVFELNDAKMARFKMLFHDPEWPQTPHWIGFDQKKSANPFEAFAQIPAKSRYQFLLDNNYFIIQSFIQLQANDSAISTDFSTVLTGKVCGSWAPDPAAPRN